MATNYNTLKSAEVELTGRFYQYIDHTREMHETALAALTAVKDGTDFSGHAQRIFAMERVANLTKANLMDEVVWTISREQPRAGDLRFLTAILCSIIDLERICDYAKGIALFLTRFNKLPGPALELAIGLERLSLAGYGEIFEIFKAREADHAYRHACKLRNDFGLAYLKTFKQLGGMLIREPEMLLQNGGEMFLNLVILFKHVERIIDHVTNVTEYFVYIKEADFFSSAKKINPQGSDE